MHLGLMGEAAKKYIEAGLPGNITISTDHECFTAAEALDKLKYGMKILIREGSAAKNFEALIDLMQDHYNNMMFCSDDKHPDSLVDGHINQLCARAVAKGIDVFKVLQAACVNPVLHYNMNVGLMREGDAADFIVVKDLKDFEVMQTYIDGNLVAKEGKSLVVGECEEVLNNFNCTSIELSAVSCQLEEFGEVVYAIEALDGQLITNKITIKKDDLCSNTTSNTVHLTSNIEKDLLKMVAVNRYNNAPVAKAFIKNFGLKEGAMASSVAHDSHNIVAVGVDDESICKAVNLVIKEQGGVSAVSHTKEMVLGLPVAGLMSNENGYLVAEKYTAIDKMVKQELHSTLTAPFMTLSFMALLVIPHLKLSDKGLFDGDRFEFITKA